MMYNVIDVFKSTLHYAICFVKILFKKENKLQFYSDSTKS